MRNNGGDVIIYALGISFHYGLSTKTVKVSTPKFSFASKR
jgi:hypothetical protein